MHNDLCDVCFGSFKRLTKRTRGGSYELPPRILKGEYMIKYSKIPKGKDGKNMIIGNSVHEDKDIEIKYEVAKTEPKKKSKKED